MRPKVANSICPSSASTRTEASPSNVSSPSRSRGDDRPRRLLSAKLVVVAVLGGFGAYDRVRVVPLVDRSPDASLRRTVTAEAALVVVVVALTALLVNTSPT